MIFEFINHDKVTFFSARTSPNSSLFPCQVKHVCLPLILFCERDPENIFDYQRDTENYTDQVSNFFLYGGHEYIHTIFRPVILVSVFLLQVYVTFSLFFKSLLTESIHIFREKLFRGTCFLFASNTQHHKFFPIKTSSLHWNGAA